MDNTLYYYIITTLKNKVLLMKRKVYILILFVANLFLLIPFFMIVAIVNLKYPIFKLLFGKSRFFNLKTIKPAHRKSIDLSLKNFTDDFGIEAVYQQRFFNLIEKFAKAETTYIYDLIEKEYCYSRIRYIFHIIELAKYALFELNRISKKNKTIGYYEDTKNSSLDTLIKEFQDRLEAKGHEQLYLKQARREVQVNRLLAKMKKHNRLFFNFYLTIFTLFPIENMRSKIPKEDMDIFEFILNIFNFYSIGHATPNQIYKSVAIQIYKYYQDYFSKEELELMIGDLIDLCFQTDSPYKNFNNIDQEPYIKNLIAQFPLFECNNNLTKEQTIKTKRFFIAKNLLVPRVFPHFLKHFIVDKYIQKPLPFYQKYALLTFFGIMPRKI